jgi:Tfp pilus assembly protein PilX
MKNIQQRHRFTKQGGVVLVVGLILLALMTLIIVSAFSLSSSNLKTITNIQRQNEAVAAADFVIEDLVRFANNFKSPPGTVFNISKVDINGDGLEDFEVQPTVSCVTAILVSESSQSDVELGPDLSNVAYWIVESNLAVTVTDRARSGATVVVNQGIRTQMSDSEKNIACPA